MKEHLGVSILTAEEVLLVSKSPTADANATSRLHALDNLAALIQHKDKGVGQHASSMQQADDASLQVGMNCTRPFGAALPTSSCSMTCLRCHASCCQPVSDVLHSYTRD